MSPGTSLGPQECVAAFAAAAGMLDVHAPGLDEINVFPVDDRDTGRNMASTMQALADAVDHATRFADMSDATASALNGARGESGRILGHYLAGFVRSLVNTERADAGSVGFAFEDAAVAARATIENPEPGTMLTVADVAAAAAMDAVDRGDDVAGLLGQVADAAVEALERTPDECPVLAHHGVVDAGGAGLCVVLEALAVVGGGGEPDVEPDSRRPGQLEALRWNVRFTIDADDAGADALRERLGSLGSAAEVSGGPQQWACRIDCGDIGAVIEAALSVGRPRMIRVDPAGDG